MRIFLKKFGAVLVSRPAGKEAFLALQPMLKDAKNNEKFEIDFEGVAVLTPSWADEFITPLFDQHGKNIALINAENSSVKATLKTLEKAKLEKVKKK